MDRDQLVRDCPTVYHMADGDSWPNIRKYGLMSTSALLDLFEKRGAERFSLESEWRPHSVTITHPVHGNAVIRDQKPMPENGLRQVLKGMTTRQWYELINRKTFFWGSWTRLSWMLSAYRDSPHCVLFVETRALLERHMGEMSLTDQNSGSIYSNRTRGADTFRSIGEFNSRYVAELAIDYKVSDIVDLTIKVELWKGDAKLGQVWSRS